MIAILNLFIKYLKIFQLKFKIKKFFLKTLKNIIFFFILNFFHLMTIIQGNIQLFLQLFFLSLHKISNIVFMNKK